MGNESGHASYKEIAIIGYNGTVTLLSIKLQQSEHTYVYNIHTY